MSRRIRSFAAALAATAVLGSNAVPAQAYQDEGLSAREKHVPIWLDAVMLRPLGLVLTATGAAFSVVPMAFVAITRPTDILKPLEVLVARPFRYTFLDPLGEHPAVTNR
jgi:hypothetical protein